MGGVAAAPPGLAVPHRPAIWGPAASLASQHREAFTDAAVPGRGGVQGGHRCQQPWVLPRALPGTWCHPSTGTRPPLCEQPCPGSVVWGKGAMGNSFCPQDPREGRCLRHSSGTLVLPITFRAALRPLLPQTYCVAIMRTSVLRVRDRQVTTRVRIICTGWFPHL